YAADSETARRSDPTALTGSTGFDGQVWRFRYKRPTQPRRNFRNGSDRRFAHLCRRGGQNFRPRPHKRHKLTLNYTPQSGFAEPRADVRMAHRDRRLSIVAGPRLVRQRKLKAGPIGTSCKCVLERWLSGRKRRFAKSVWVSQPTMGSNPILSVIALRHFQ